MVNACVFAVLGFLLSTTALAQLDASSAAVPSDTPMDPNIEDVDTLVSITKAERQRICSLCPECPMCKRLDPLKGYHKLEIRMFNSDPNPENRIKRIVDLTKPARYHCGKCPTCYCYYRAWRRG